MFKIGILGSDNSQALMFAKLCTSSAGMEVTSTLFQVTKTEIEYWDAEKILYKNAMELIK